MKKVKIFLSAASILTLTFIGASSFTNSENSAAITNSESSVMPLGLRERPLGLKERPCPSGMTGFRCIWSGAGVPCRVPADPSSRYEKIGIWFCHTK